MHSGAIKWVAFVTLAAAAESLKFGAEIPSCPVMVVTRDDEVAYTHDWRMLGLINKGVCGHGNRQVVRVVGLKW